NSGKIKSKWPFVNKSFLLNTLLFILLIPIGIPAQIFYYIPIFIAKILTIRFKPRREFFLSIRIGITWAIIVIWLMLFFLIIGFVWSFTYALIFLLTAPLVAKLGLIW